MICDSQKHSLHAVSVSPVSVYVSVSISNSVIVSTITQHTERITMHSASAYCTCISMYLYCSLYHYQCSATSLNCKVELCRCTLYAKPHMYTYMTYVYRISTMSLCTLHQYQTVSVCYDLTQLHKEYQQSTILSFRSLFCTLSRSCACLLISDLQRPESSTCMHMWAQATVQQVH